MDILDVLTQFDWTGDPNDVERLKRMLADFRLGSPTEMHQPLLLIGGGSGTPTVARSLLTCGRMGFSMLANTSDRSRDAATLQLTGAGLLKEQLGAIDWADILKQLLEPTPRLEWSPLRALLEVKVGEMRRGYLVLEALAEIHGIQAAVATLANALGNTWRVMPTTLELTDIMFRLDGQALGLYEYATRSDGMRIADEVFLSPSAHLSPLAAQAIFAAKTIIIGPGDVHFSVLPHWLINGFSQALESNRDARMILIPNLTARKIDIPGFTLTRFLDFWDSRFPSGREVLVLVNNGPADFEDALVDDLVGHTVYSKRFRLVRRTIAAGTVLLTSNKQPQHNEQLLGMALLDLI